MRISAELRRNSEDVVLSADGGAQRGAAPGLNTRAKRLGLVRAGTRHGPSPGAEPSGPSGTCSVTHHHPAGVHSKVRAITRDPPVASTTT
jgi:hypothetical protein